MGGPEDFLGDMYYIGKINTGVPPGLGGYLRFWGGLDKPLRKENLEAIQLLQDPNLICFLGLVYPLVLSANNQVWLNASDFIFSSLTPAYRYIRIYCWTRWNGGILPTQPSEQQPRIREIMESESKKAKNMDRGSWESWLRINWLD